MPLIIPEKNKSEETENKLGISRGVYALGRSLKDSFIWFAGALAVLVPTMLVFQHRQPVKGLMDIYKSVKNWEETKKKELGENYKNLFPIILSSVGIAWITSHIIQIPSGIAGWRKAQDAISKYNALDAETDQLLKTNKVLLGDNKILREDKIKLEQRLAALQENKPPMADRVMQSSADAGIGGLS